ncbi:MAG TPA: YceI family protein [Gemmatimonadales bacterium]|nr:YceI family protein [Gemmatimonadales bacterium]
MGHRARGAPSRDDCSRRTNRDELESLDRRPGAQRGRVSGPEAASVTARIQTASVTTGNDRRDNDLKQNYLVVDSFPEMKFVSERVERVAGAPERLRITSDLTIRGVTREVALDAEIGGVAATPMGRRTAFSATTAVKRQDFGITRNPFLEGTQMVGGEVRITIDIEAVEH